MKKTLWGFIWSRFKSLQGFLISIISIIFAYLLWRFSPDSKIELAIVLPICIILIVIIITLFDSTNEIYKLSKHLLPKIILGK